MEGRRSNSLPEDPRQRLRTLWTATVVGGLISTGMMVRFAVHGNLKMLALGAVINAPGIALLVREFRRARQELREDRGEL